MLVAGAVAFAAASVLGLLTKEIGLTPIVGYLPAGAIIGWYTLGAVADSTLTPKMAEMGAILLMFGAGLPIRLNHLLAVRIIAIPGPSFRARPWWASWHIRHSSAKVAGRSNAMGMRNGYPHRAWNP